MERDKPIVCPSFAAQMADKYPQVDEECQRVIDAIIDYNMVEVHKKMELHGVDFELALQMHLAVMRASAGFAPVRYITEEELEAEYPRAAK